MNAHENLGSFWAVLRVRSFPILVQHERLSYSTTPCSDRAVYIYCPIFTRNLRKCLETKIDCIPSFL